MRTVVSNELEELIHKLDKVNLREEADKARSIAHEVDHLIQKLEFARRLYVLLSDSLEDNEYVQNETHWEAEAWKLKWESEVLNDHLELGFTAEHAAEIVKGMWLA